MADSIDNTQDLIDSRDVIARIAELEAYRVRALVHYLPKLDEDEATELAALCALAEEAEGYSLDWKYGETLIRDSYFQEYAQELAEDTGVRRRAVQWPNNCIDWEKAAHELQQDYTPVKLDGVTYWIH